MKKIVSQFPKKIKQHWKICVVIILIVLLFFYWEKILVFSNYKVIWYELTGLFNQSQQSSTTSSPEIVFKENSLEISKIKISVPIILGRKDAGQKEAAQKLKKGVLLYSEFLPGEKGRAIIMGHSASVDWPEIDFDKVFNNLNQLEKGDEVIVYYNQRKYVYEVFEKKIFLPKDEKQALAIEDKNQSVLILLTCWPLGKDTQRLAVLTKLKK